MPDLTRDNQPWKDYVSNIKTVVIGENVTSIGNYAFYNCSSLTSITLPASVTSLGNYAFAGCRGLTSITLPASVTSIGNYAFINCRGLTSITLPASVTSIGNYAFINCSGLTSITLPASVTSLGNYAFAGCSGLTSITLPASVTSIGNHAFYSCSGLMSLDLSKCTSLTTIGEYAFYGCSVLTSLDLSNCTSLTTIGERAFYNCSVLTSLDLSNCTSLTTIGERAFYNCSKLESLDLSNCTSLTSIDAKAFAYCSGLKSITLPTSLTSLGANAFKDCAGLTEVNFGVEGKAVLINGKILGTGTFNIKDAIGTSAASLRCLDFENVNYVGADGKTTTVSAIPIISGLIELAAGTYVVKDTIALNDLTLNGEVNLILADGANLTAGTISGGTLNVFSQGGETLGKLTATEISSAFNYNGGNVTATTISGATTLNWTNANDTIDATYTGTANIVDGKRFYNSEGNIITTSASNERLNALDSYLIEIPTGATITGATQIGTTNKYVCKSGAEVTISGFNSGEISFDPLITSLEKSGDNIVVKASDDTALTISGLTFPVGSDSWKTEDTSSNYGTRYTSGALISDSKIVWDTPADDIFVTVTGLKSGVTLNDTNITIAIDDKKLTINDEALLTDGATISADNDYTVELATALAPTNAVSKGWEGNNYYSSDGYKTAGWFLTNGKVEQVNVLTPAVTISGVKTTDGITVANNVVTLTEANLNGENITLTGDGYTLTLAKDVDTTKETISEWVTLSGGNIAYYAGGTGEYYSLNSEKTAVTYNASVAGANQVEFSGVEGTPTLKSSIVNLTASNFNSNVSVVSNEGGYSFALSGDFQNKTFTGTANTDEIKNSGSNLVILGGAGNDILRGGNDADTLSGGADNDKLFGNAGNDSLSGGDGNDTLSGSYGDDKLLGGAGNDSLSGCSGNDTLSGGDGNDKLLGGSGNDSLSGGDGNDTLSGYTGKDILLGGKGNDSLNGGSNNDTLYGGAGDDTLIGGVGNDSLWGDTGADTFIYSSGDGKDIIYGFESKDTLTLDGLDFTASYSKTKGTVTLKFNSGSITFKEFTATTFHINNDTYKISGSTLKKQ